MTVLEYFLVMVTIPKETHNGFLGFLFVSENGGSKCFHSLFDGNIVEFEVESGSDGRTKAVDVTGPGGAKVV
ncbi:hypothetical protein H5410_026015 [Solanum commersonii]|uniref:Uncharacterized protein n=1 Tax=Solanum commersonii TaxID=4109 RepID=A0A9J5YUV3_SOLCO|nr:hypothetical protein H5410_026015 [Solanum commersonii]